jgi:uncharacterized protein (TIGR02588 family)
LTVIVDSVAKASSGYLARITVHNTGGSTAAQVEIEGELTVGGEMERSEVTLDYVPDRSQKHAGLMFRRNPLPDH